MIVNTMTAVAQPYNLRGKEDNSLLLGVPCRPWSLHIWYAAAVSSNQGWGYEVTSGQTHQSCWDKTTPNHAYCTPQRYSENQSHSPEQKKKHNIFRLLKQRCSENIKECIVLSLPTVSVVPVILGWRYFQLQQTVEQRNVLHDQYHNSLQWCPVVWCPVCPRTRMVSLYM